MVVQPDHAEDADANVNPGPPLTTPRIVQTLPITSTSEHSSNIETMSHAHTTVDSQQAEEDKIAGSVYSYNSTRDITAFVRDVYGRTYNNLSDSYPLPTDNDEWNRLDKQHSAFWITMGNLYPCPDIVDAVLAFDPSDTEPKRILDIGSGTGAWAIEMVAIRFPHAAVKGVDLAPNPIDSDTFPPNLEFEIDDVNLGLSQFYGLYSVVHMRCTMVGLTDIDKTWRELQLCLKPGGLLIIIDGDIELRDEQHNKVKMKRLEGDNDVDSISDTGSWWQRVVWETHQAVGMGGVSRVRSGEMIDHGLWDQPLCDPDTAVAGSLYMPIGPWATSSDPGANQALRYVGLLMRQVFLNIHRAYHVILRKYGIPVETLEAWSSNIDQELNAMEKHMWVRFRFCYARRRAGDGLPAPPLQLPTPPTFRPSTGGTAGHEANPESIREGARRPQNRYPGFETFHSREEAVAARVRRRATIGVWPQSVVARAHTAQSGE